MVCTLFDLSAKEMQTERTYQATGETTARGCVFG